MSSPEIPKPESPQERFVRIKAYYQEAVDQGRMNGGPFKTIFSSIDPTKLTHEVLDGVGRKMNAHWVGDPRSRYHK